ERMERHGVLVVGPNPAFLHHIRRPESGFRDALDGGLGACRRCPEGVPKDSQAPLARSPDRK
ncbi:hypothetical protein AB0E54_27150, partial [Amycolatopsis coloradensis]|uniref:hypothetical protein n=1 Tax=Amycolatopsis coloradensis TaxID=76021 RepID=UPI00340F68A8